jgi:small subunit ribosomal protein S2
MKQFLEAGTHFGHQTRRWNPKMRPYIFGAKSGIHIIDLQKTLRQLKVAYEYVRDLTAQGETLLFVGTKPQAKEIIREEATRSNSAYIDERWLGGLLTNFGTIKQSVAKLKKLEEIRGEAGLYEGVLKKEAVRLERQRAKLQKALGGIKEMRKLPGALFVIDCKKEKIALQEAQKLGVPIVAVVDTNCDPDGIQHVIPGNDDAIRSIRLFAGTIAEAAIEGRALYEAKLRSLPEESPRPQRGGRASRESARVSTPEVAAAAVEKMQEKMAGGPNAPAPESKP